MANIATRADRERMKIERRSRRLLRREFTRYARDAADNAGQFVVVTQQHAERLAAILAALYERAIPLGVEFFAEEMVKALKQDATTEALIERILADWVGTRAFEQAASISAASRAVAQTALDLALREGLGEAETARRIRGAVDSLSPSRARTIARTESHGAMMNAGAEGAAQLGAIEKEWVAIEDDRTRETHVEADTQKVPMNSTFLVGSASLRFPGDPDAGAPEETINCRCAVAYS